jgi:hypothetical protein
MLQETYCMVCDNSALAVRDATIVREARDAKEYLNDLWLYICTRVSRCLLG